MKPRGNTEVTIVLHGIEIELPGADAQYAHRIVARLRGELQRLDWSDSFARAAARQAVALKLEVARDAQESATAKAIALAVQGAFSGASPSVPRRPDRDRVSPTPTIGSAAPEIKPTRAR